MENFGEKVISNWSEELTEASILDGKRGVITDADTIWATVRNKCKGEISKFRSEVISSSHISEPKVERGCLVGRGGGKFGCVSRGSELGGLIIVLVAIVTYNTSVSLLVA